MICKKGAKKQQLRLCRIICRGAMVEKFFFPSTIAKGRKYGLKIAHPITNKIITTYYQYTLIYWSKKTWVYIFVEP